MNQDAPGNPPPPASPPPPYVAPAPPAPLTEAEARTWAMVSHLTVLLNLVTIILGVVAPLAIYLFLKDRSRYVAFHAMESFVFQLIAWAAAGRVLTIMWAITWALVPFGIGLLCIPFALVISIALGLLPIAALVYGVYGGIEANQGKDFRYWLIGDWVRNRMPA